MKAENRKHLFFLMIITAFIITQSTTNIYADFGSTPLKKGMNHEDVAQMQKALHILGFLDDPQFTGYFGDKTFDAVQDFQLSLKRFPDGIASKELLLQMKLKITQLDKLYDFNEKPAVVKKEPIKLASRAAISRRVIEISRKYLGTKYVWGASTGKAFDCSGFTMYVMKKFGIKLDHSAAMQFSQGSKVSRSSLEIGDLVFFTTYKKGASHVGIYIGGNKFIHASSSGKGVIVSDLDQRYYRERYLGARRYGIK